MAEISLYYDPMIAKLVTYGADRSQAIERQLQALDGFYVSGVRNNVAFLAAITASRRFRDGALSTDFIAQEFPHGFAPPAEFTDADRVVLIAAAVAARRIGEVAGAIDGAATPLSILLDAVPHAVSIRRELGDYAVEHDGGTSMASSDWVPGNPLLRLKIDGQPATVQIERLPAQAFRLVHGGVIRRVQVLSPRAAELLLKMPVKQPADTSRLVLSPMPGLLTTVLVSEGQEVKAGEPLVTVEAMKMENVLRAERDGRIAKLRAEPGASLAVDQIILEFE